ncbi:MAG: helix-turn-helix domain-containing protein, partial [Bacteroidetes bacterium]|nr:helix-turn-helix domain-containing protein [Bacteroidota bacterium]
PSAEAAWLERVQEVVEAHLEDTGFSVRQLADEVGLSTRQLQRKLKAITSLSPSGFIRMMRLERAAQLLGQQAGTVAEIAYAVGFKDADYFSKQFREAFGQPPSAYAAAAAQEQDAS